MGPLAYRRRMRRRYRFARRMMVICFVLFILLSVLVLRLLLSPGV
jgi:hypothetical protein